MAGGRYFLGVDHCRPHGCGWHPRARVKPNETDINQRGRSSSWAPKEMIIWRFSVTLALLMIGGALAEEVIVETLTVGSVVSGPASQLKIYAYHGEPKSITAIWKTIMVEILVDSEDYLVYEASDAETVLQQHKESNYFWNLWLFKSKLVHVKVFEKTFFGVWSNKPFKVQLVVRRIDYYKIGYLIIGLLLFKIAPHLSRKQYLYYSSGLVFGTITATLIVVFLVGRLIPKRVGAFGVIAAGWPVCIYGMTWLWKNLYMVLQQYQLYCVAYLATAGFMSFGIMYIRGPINHRGQQLIEWGLQLVALLLVFYSSEVKELTLLVILLVVILSSVPSKWIVFLRSKVWFMWMRYISTPQPVLLTEEEYYEEGVRETRKALTTLRAYCRSPDCDSWKVMQSLKDPLQFVNGDSHISDEQLMEYADGIKEEEDDTNSDYYDQD